MFCYTCNLRPTRKTLSFGVSLNHTVFLVWFSGQDRTTVHIVEPDKNNSSALQTGGITCPHQNEKEFIYNRVGFTQTQGRKGLVVCLQALTLIPSCPCSPSAPGGPASPWRDTRHKPTWRSNTPILACTNYLLAADSLKVKLVSSTSWSFHTIDVFWDSGVRGKVVLTFEPGSPMAPGSPSAPGPPYKDVTEEKRNIYKMLYLNIKPIK